MTKQNSKHLTNLFLALSLSIPVTSLLLKDAAASERKEYICDAIGDGNYVVAISSENPANAFAVYSLGGDLADINNTADRIILKPAFTGFEFNYKSKDVQFAGVEDKAFLIDNGSQSVVQCQLQASVQSSKTLNLAGYALGGKVRSGPGVNFPQTGSVREKEVVTLLENSGVTMDGYDWFKIKRSNGEVGYQWGGILCSDNKSIKGIFEQCL